MAIPLWASEVSDKIVAVYQPKLAASQAASLQNLANPGTNDATVTQGTLQWDANHGWIGDGATYLSGPVMQSGYSVICKYSAIDVPVFPAPCIIFGGGDIRYGILSYANSGKADFYYNDNSYQGRRCVGGVVGIRSDNAFIGPDKYAYIGAATTFVDFTFTMLGHGSYGMMRGNLEAIVIMDESFTDEEYESVRQAMITDLPNPITEYYAAPDVARGTGTGTLADPASFSDLVEYPIEAGNTIYLRGGTYILTDVLNVYLSGEPDAPITIRPYGNETVKLDLQYQIVFNGDYTNVHDIEFFCTDYPHHSELIYSNPDDGINEKGVKMYARGGKVINCIFHDASGWGGTALGGAWYGNVVYYCGWTASDRPHGHALYIEPIRDPAYRTLVKHNFFFNTFGGGLHVYGSAGKNSYLDVEENLSFKIGRLQASWGNGGYGYGFLLWSSARSIDNHFERNLAYKANLSFYSAAAGCEGLYVKDNYWGPNHSLYGPPHANDTLAEGSDTDVYLSIPPTYPDDPDWPDPTSGKEIFVWKNDYKAKSGFVTIYNWDKDDSVDVDLSAISDLVTGDTITLWDVQAGVGNGLTKYAVPASKIISVDMRASSHSQSLPTGDRIDFQLPKNTWPQFGSFIVRQNLAPSFVEGSSVDVIMSTNSSPFPFNLTLHATNEYAELITWGISAQASNGTASVSGTGTEKVIKYVPDEDYAGADSFIVTVTDSYDQIANITVNVTIQNSFVQDIVFSPPQPTHGQIVYPVVTECSTSVIGVNFLTAQGSAATPATITYEVYDSHTGTVLQPKTSITSGSSIDIQIVGSANRIVKEWRKRELHIVLVRINEGFDSSMNAEYKFYVKNLGRI